MNRAILALAGALLLISLPYSEPAPRSPLSRLVATIGPIRTLYVAPPLIDKDKPGFIMKQCQAILISTDDDLVIVDIFDNLSKTPQALPYTAEQKRAHKARWTWNRSTEKGTFEWIDQRQAKQ